MLLAFLYPLYEDFSALHVFKYISFRVFGAAITSVLISIVLGPWLIDFLQKKQMKQVIRTEGPQSHYSKKGTPTMGGSLIILSVCFSCLLWGDLTNQYMWMAVGVTTLYGLIGFVDDYRKVIQKNTKGLSGRAKLFFQSLIALSLMYYLFQTGTFPTEIRFPFFKELSLEMGGIFILFGALVIVGASNAVNLTDGLDGLALGPTITTSATFLILAYCAGHKGIAEYLQIPYVGGTGELAVFLATVAASCLGFLWYNTYPAQIFMGDVGSLALGGALGTAAVLTKNEILLALCGGVFVAEAMSVMIQVGYFKRTGKRVFKMAPIHHHFELKGLPEPKVIVRFWIVSIVLALMTLSTLKLR